MLKNLELKNACMYMQRACMNIRNCALI